jgi:ATP-binding cassette subfamily B protein
VRSGVRIPLRDRLHVALLLPKLVALIWETNAGYTIAVVALRLGRSVVPVATLWVGKLIIDNVVEILQHGKPSAQLWTLLGVEMAIAIVGELLARASNLAESLLGDLFTNRISIRIMQHAATLDLHQFEDPEFYDHLERARQGAAGRVALLGLFLGLVQSMLTLVSLSVGLAAAAPRLLVLLAVSIAPSFAGETHFAALSYSLMYRRTPQRRQLEYLHYIGASDRTAKEVQLFGLAPWLIDRYRQLADQFFGENRTLAVRKAVASSALSLGGTLGYYAAYFVVLLQATSGALTIGMLTFLVASFRHSRDLMQSILLTASNMYEQTLYLRDLFAFLEITPTITQIRDARPVPRPIREGLIFDDVGFRYPGSDRWAVRHLSFMIRPGERIALVGENGAGKTTMTKLIARLYDPSEGRILLDGVDLREYDIGAVRRTIGVIFQDFVRYDLRFDENVGVGAVDTVREYLDAERSNAATPPASIATSAEHSLAASLLPRLAAGYGQMLGRRFEDGVDLSGGEWQKVALARAYMRDAQILILDEPTAALDARAEYEAFVRFNHIMAGRMAVVISHRFSTVRMADRIIVLKSGGIIEHGTHGDLVTARGLYSELFAMQAGRYN